MKVRRLLGIAALAAVAVPVASWLSGWLRNGVRDGIAPYERFAGWSSRGFVSATAWWDAAAVGAKNQALESRVRELETELMAVRVLKADNAELRRQLDCERGLPQHVTAEVLSHGGGDGWSQRLRIGKGREDGILPNCPVLAPEGLVGRVVEAAAATADVLLITDLNSQVACAFEPDVPSARGILAGGGVRLAGPPTLQLLHTVEPLQLEYLEKDLMIPGRAKVVTSGLGGVYPRGIPVGFVAETEPDASGLFQRAKVVPHVDFSSLRFVTVLVGMAQPELRSGRAR